MIVFGLASGCASVESISRYVKERLHPQTLRSFGFFGDRFPCGQTLRDVAAKLCPRELSAAVEACAEAHKAGATLHLDGKT